MTAPQTARIDLRLSPEDKVLISRAAKSAGFSLSSFLVQAAYEKIESLTSRENILRLPKEAQEQIFNLLSAPPEPREALNQLLNSKTNIDNEVIKAKQGT